jgi:hypothetical protein
VDLINLESKQLQGSEVDVEMVQQEKQELKHLGTYLKTANLKLYYYNPVNGEFGEVNIVRSNTIYIEVKEGKLVPVDRELEKVVVDSRMEFFEALNKGTAFKRIKKWKEGKIKQLCNLRYANPYGIQFF